MAKSNRLGQGNPPSIASHFVGRTRELRQLGELLSGMVRLVTLVGAGGIGKTRLAAEAVSRYTKSRKVPVYWVGLAGTAAGAEVAALEFEVAHAVVDLDFSDRSRWNAVVDRLSRTDAVGVAVQSVLVLDNCEHVLAAAGDLIAELLDVVPGLSIVATSREPIGWVDERLIPVPPLTSEQALSLFRHRAKLVSQPLAGADDASMAGEICQHMHYFPLHIRLAAARLTRQPLPLILRDLNGAASDRRMQWSQPPLGGADERHRSIRDVIAWSYELCEDNEQLLFRRMAVFAVDVDVPTDDAVVGGQSGGGGAELAAVVAVCADEDGADGRPRLSAAEIPELLERLVDRSLVASHLSTDAVYYALAESFRIFAQQQLWQQRDGDDEFAMLLARHRRYYRDRVVRARASWFSTQDKPLLEWARRSWDNLGIAIESSVATPEDASIGLEISLGLLALRAPLFVGSLPEIRRWTESALAAVRRPGHPHTELEIAAMGLLVWSLMSEGGYRAAERLLEAAVAACLPDAAARAGWRDRPDADLGLAPEVEFARGCELMLAQRDPRAVTVLARARELATARGDYGVAAISEMIESWAASLLGTAPIAMATTRRYLDNATRAGATMAMTWAQVARAIALTKHGDPVEALAAGRAALADQVPMGDRVGALWAVHVRVWSLSKIIATRGDGVDKRAATRELAREAAHLIGGAETQRRMFGIVLGKQGLLADEHTRAIETIRNVLGAKVYDAVVAEGVSLRYEFAEAERLALGDFSIRAESADTVPADDVAAAWLDLTESEQDVAVLAAAGWTNSAIAARRGSSYRTVDAQMSTIFQKLHITSRTEVIDRIPADQRPRVRDAAQDRPRRR
ncbi:LuxR C-terminal-related transcriptional regulator [Nocardia sp. NPDC049149]|uniref:LuxR C-terminal-related transcriptional regulator n=1 Tax=Nocardia sp. NPDC049149 TaxID=3364315 RepID=UPI003720014D